MGNGNQLIIRKTLAWSIKTEKIKMFKKFVCKKGHLFSLNPKDPTCPIDGTMLKEMQTPKKVYE